MTIRGKFITFEGPEGGGKTTQARRLVARLQAAGRQVLYTREPGGTPTGEAIREILQHNKAGEAPCPETEVLLFAASRAQLVRHVIIPALERGDWVVCDRFADSTRAYQGAAGKLDRGFIARLESVALAGLKPDLTLVLDLPAARGLERAALRRGAGAEADRFEREGVEFHETLRRAFLDIADAEPERCAVIDAAKSERAVGEAIWTEVRRRFAFTLTPKDPS